jgi:hypothetical protein
MSEISKVIFSVIVLVACCGVPCVFTFNLTMHCSLPATSLDIEYGDSVWNIILYKCARDREVDQRIPLPVLRLHGIMRTLFLSASATNCQGDYLSGRRVLYICIFENKKL